jgi:hypothetical protein
MIPEIQILWESARGNGSDRQRGEAEMLEFRQVKSEARVSALTGKLNDFDLFSLILV